MTTHTFADFGLAEPESYALVIDARTPHEFADDHIPGAVNLPVVDDAQFAEVGTVYAGDTHAAYLVGAEYATRNLARHIRSHIAQCAPGDRLLVYCFRGGKRSRVWADTLRNIGFATDVLPGGWKAYRAWVREGLDTLPPRFDYRVLSGLTGCGKTRLLQALDARQQQVLDLEALAAHRGSLLGALPDTPQPPQKLFDSRLFERLRGFDRARPVWIEAESKKIGNLQLPEALHAAIVHAAPITVSAPMDLRVRLLKQEYPNFVADPGAMVDRLAPLKPLVGGEELAAWRALAQRGAVDELFERVLVAHYDPSYRRSIRRGSDAAAPVHELHLGSIGEADLADAAGRLAQQVDAARTA